MKTHITDSSLGIKSWSYEDRPREKLISKGRANLTDAELLAILISSGTSKHTALDLAKQILLAVDHDISKLAYLSVNDLTEFPGIGLAKAVTITAAFEIGRRRQGSLSIKKQISSAADVYEAMTSILLDQPIEQFWTMLLDRANQVIKISQISLGGISGTVVDPRVIFKEAIDNRASGIILIHNHPSGNLKPSQADKQITDKIQKGANLLDVHMLDHVIFTDEGYFSFKDQGLI